MYTQVMVTMMIAAAAAHKVPDERGGAAGGCRSKVPARVVALYRSHFYSPRSLFSIEVGVDTDLLFCLKQTCWNTLSICRWSAAE